MNSEYLDDLFADWLGGDFYRVQITRKAPASHAGYIGTIEVESLDEIDKKILQLRFGGGTYYLRVKDSKGKYVTHRTVRIEGEPKESRSSTTTGYAAEHCCDTCEQQDELNMLHARLDKLEQQIQLLYMCLPSR